MRFVQIFTPQRDRTYENRYRGSLDADLSDVLPALRKEGSQEVEGLQEVSSDLVASLFFLSNSSVNPGDTLDFEPGGVVELLDLVLDVCTFRDDDWESLDRGEWFTDQLVQVSVESRGDQDDIVASGPLLDLLEVVVELLEEVNIDVLDVALDALVSVDIVDDADDLEVSLDLVWKVNVSCQLLLLLCVVVSEADLELNSLWELSWL